MSEWPKFLIPEEASRYLWLEHGVKAGPGHLRVLRCRGGGPVFRRQDGRVISYEPPDLDEWAKKKIRKVASTSELPPRKSRQSLPAAPA